MSQYSSNTLAGSRGPGPVNIYTLMLVVAFLALTVACVYVLVRHHTLFGSWNPFDLSPVAGVVSLLSLPGLGG